MARTRLSSKGQVIIPGAVRDAHGWASGTEFEVEDLGNAVLLRPVRKWPRTTTEQVAGCLKYHGPAKTLAEMDEGVMREARRQV